MAFLKYAKAVVVHPRATGAVWSNIRKTASSVVTPTANLATQASQILGETFSTDRFLLTHATIVASVDVDSVPNVKLGTVQDGSRRINRKFADYFIKPECSQFVNNNGDSWSRDVLLKSYRTFIGAHNFLEHVQIEEQSKGRIIDAVARDIGPSVYVDILIATDRKHAQLVQDIESGKMATLSMGCTCEFTQCSQCGNVAVDETDMCEHVKYGKLNTFFDDQGQKRITAELCGHATHGDTGGVRFIEASWVAVPAFQGAVMRNILDPSTVSPAVVEKAAAILSSPPPEWGTTALRAASAQLRQAQDEFDFSSSDEGGGDEGGAGADEAAPGDAPGTPISTTADPLKEVEDDAYSALKERLRTRLEKDLSYRPEVPPPATAPNDNLQREAGMTRTAAQEAHKKAVGTLLRVASSDAAFVDGLAEIDRAFGVKVAQSVYRAPLLAGALDGYLSPDHYADACHRYAKRSLTSAELRFVYRVGKLLDQFRSSRLHPNRNL
jgi:hypothetical protein